MKYEKCLDCGQLSNSCDGPNLMAMETTELGLWCNELRKKKPGMTFDKIAAATGVSKSAVHGFLTGAHTDYRRETFRPIVKYITGGKWDDNPCGNLSNSEKAAYEERIHQLEEKIRLLEENARHQEYEMKLRDDTIKHLNSTNDSMKTLITNTNARHTNDKDFFKGQIKSKNRSIIILSIFLGISLAAIIAALVVDRLNSDMGFFWLSSMLNKSQHSIINGIS